MKTLSVLSGLAVLALSVNAQDNATEKFCGYTAINGLTSGRNNQKCGPLLDDAFIPYNAYYDGTVTLDLLGNPGKCPESRYTMDKYTVGIGGMKVAGNASLDRTTYDKNPFYFWWKYQTNKNISAGFISSSDYFVTESQWWTLTATKSGDGYDITGNYTGKLAPLSNVYNYPSDACWTVNIYNHIVKVDMSSPTKYNYWSMYGHVSPTALNMTIDETSLSKGFEYHTRFNFVGTASSTGARLVTTGEAPSTDAVAKGSTGSGSSGGASGGSSGSNGSSNGTTGGSKSNGAVILGGAGIQTLSLVLTTLFLTIAFLV